MASIVGLDGQRSHAQEVTCDDDNGTVDEAALDGAETAQEQLGLIARAVTDPA